MALLKDKRSQYSLALEPIMPSHDGPHNAYSVVIRDKQHLIFERQYTTYKESADGHWYVWRLFRAFQLAERMAKQTTTLNLTGRRDKRWNEPPTLSVDAGWLRVVVWSDLLTHTYGRPEPLVEARTDLSVYLLLGPQKLGENGKDFRRFSFACQPAEVVQFGKDLERECREALRLRRELSLIAPADDYIDD